MKVLLVSHGFPPEQVAGVERYTEGLGGALVAAGDTVSIVAAATGTQERCALERGHADGAAVYRLRGPKVPRDRFLLHGPALERLFEQVLAETAPDVVHVNHLIGLSPRFLAASHRHGAAVVLSLWDHYFACVRHQLVKTSGESCGGPNGGVECARTCYASEGADAEPRWTVRTEYFKLLLATAERLLCPSRYLASYFEPLLRDPTRLRVLPLGLPGPLPGRDETGTVSNGGNLRLAILGLVFANKGAHVVIEALGQAGLPARLSLHGRVVEPEYAEHLEQRAAGVPGLELSIGGAYRREDLPRLLADADCVVVPSQCPESFAFVAREALALGIPVLVSRKGALPEAVSEGRNGFTFAHDDPGELAQLLRRLRDDRRLLTRLRAGARASAPLPISAHARLVRSVYAEAMDDLARGGAVTNGASRELDALEKELVRLGFDRAER
jgi:glycosyltransferase involved in cell wall biosynthesis